MSRPNALIDGTRVAEFRRLAGLSQRSLARLIGVVPMTLQRIEEGGGHSDMTMGFVDRLAEVLGVDLAALLPTAQPPEPTQDDATIEAALAELGRYVPVEEVAQALGWTLQRANEALEALARRLDGSGSILKRKRFEYALGSRRSALSEEQHADLQRVAINRWSLHLTPARVLRDVLDGVADFEWGWKTAVWKSPALGQLVKQRLVTMEGSRPLLVPAVSFSLNIGGTASSADHRTRRAVA